MSPGGSGERLPRFRRRQFGSARSRFSPPRLGGALLAAVITVAAQFVQEREFARVVEEAQPGWLWVAAVLQAATYLAQAEVFRSAIPRSAHARFDRRWLYELSLTKLFLDQALPSAAQLPGGRGPEHAAIILLDAATMSTCIRAIGAHAPVDAVFASLMIASLVRTMGVVPGGLGTYEATSVATLHLVGIGLAAALAATLMFRGLSFWIPMLPGLWSSRRILQPASP